jgi:hypothetical protein
MQAPAACNYGGAKLLTQDGRPCTTAASRHHTSRVEQALDFRQQWRFSALAQRRAGDRRPHPVYPVVRRQDGDLPSAAEQGQETRFSLAREAEEGRAITVNKPLDRGVGHRHRFNLQTEAAGGYCQPSAEGLIAVLSQVRWRRWELHRSG